MKNIYSEEEFNTFVKKGKVVVDFYATWCGPCRMLAPILEEIEEENKDITLLKVDVDDNPELSRKYRISAIPAVYIFKDGELKDTNIGFASKKSLLDLINRS